jgi:hypothetical protein
MTGDQPGRPPPPSLPPPPFWRTRYYEDAVTHRADRRWIVADEIVAALAQPIRTERQADGRIRHWAYIPRLQAYIRIVTLADGQTVHNVFKDRDFVDE